jgi:hypothetical protein
MPKFKCTYKVSHAIRDAVKFRLNRARNTSSSSNITKASNQIPTSTSQISNDRLSELDRMLEGFACPAPTDIKCKLFKTPWSHSMSINEILVGSTLLVWFLFFSGAEDRWSSGNGNQLQKLEEDSSLINTGEEQTTSNHKVGNNIPLSRVASIGCHDLSNTDFFNFNDRVNVNEWNSRSIKGDKHDGFTTCTSDPNDLVEVKWCESKQQCDDDESFVKDIEEVLGPLQPDERIFYERLGSWESDDQ